MTDVDPTRAGQTSEAPPAAVVLMAAAVGGAGVMSVELAAVRLIAPWFGSSLTVWTNVLGTVLVALSLGYLLGGRLAVGPRPAARLGTALGLGAVFTASLPWIADRVAGLFLPESLALGEALDVLTWGSLATSLLLFLPPAALLGTVGPLAVEAIQRRSGGHAGTAGGLVLALSTLGSIAGTFATTHLLLPGLGLSGTFGAAAAVLAGAGLLIWLGDRGARGTALAGLLGLLAAGATFGAGPDPAAEVGHVRADGSTLLALRESRYQRVRVVQEPEGAPVARRLEVNERSDSFQSVWQPEPGLLPYGFYYNDFALPVWWARDEAGAAPPQWRVLLLGLGAGTVWRVLEGSVPEGTRIGGDGVELDPVVVELARDHLDLPGEGAALAVHGGLDARACLRALPGPYDQVVLDTYANQVEIPPHLGSVEFFEELAERLSEGGWMTVNVGAFGLDDPILEALGDTVARAFGGAAVAMVVPGARNVTLVARRGAPLPRELGVESLGSEAIDALLWPRSVAGMVRTFDGSGSVLTDDHSPLLALQRSSLRAAADRRLPTAERGREVLRELGEDPLQVSAVLDASRRLESAGALERAYAVARLGVEVAPDELEFQLRCAAVALSLSRPDAAAEHLAALETGIAAASLGVDVRTWWEARLAENRDWLETTRGVAVARESALGRGRAGTLLGLGGMAVVGAVLTRRRREA